MSDEKDFEHETVYSEVFFRMQLNPSYSWEFRYEAERKPKGQGRRVKMPGGIAMRYVEDILTRERCHLGLQSAAAESLRNRMG